MWEILTFETLYNGQSKLFCFSNSFQGGGGGGRGRYGICSTDSLLFTVTTKAIYILRLINLSHRICTLMMKSHLYLT